MKIHKIVLIIFIVYFIISILIILKTNDSVYVYHEPSFSKTTYGQSKYYYINKNLKVSLEKVTQEKYFIVYSQITGNESYFGTTLIIENINKEPIDKTSFNYIYIKDPKTNTTYYPIPYYEIENIPTDRPLKWKAKFYAKFLPLPYQTQFIDIYFRFCNLNFVLNNVDIR